jgi:Protein of unknown function/AsmA-like C-terminal region
MDARANRASTQTIEDWQAVKLRESDRLWEYRFVCLLLLLLAGLAIYHVVHARINDSLRDRLQQLLAKQYPNHLIALDAAHLEQGRGIWLEGLTIAMRTTSEPRVIVRIPRLIAQGDICLVGLIQGQVPIHRVTVDAIDLSVFPMSDGRTSLETLTNDRPLPDVIPAIDIRRGLVRLSHEGASSNQAIILHDLNVSIRPQNNPNSASSSGISIAAQVSSGYFSKLRMAVELSKDKQHWTMHGSVDELFYSSHWTDKLPLQWRSYLAQLAGFHGYIGAGFEVKKRVDQTPTFYIHGRIRDGRLQHPNLPYPLQELAGNIFVQNNMLQLREATARSGEARFELEADIRGLAVSAPMVAKLKIEQLALDDRLFQALPPSMQEQWTKFQVAGTVDANMTLRFDGRNWSPDIRIHTQNGAVNADFFPYPINSLQGDFHYRDGLLTSQGLIASAGGQTLRGTVQLARASPKWLVDMSISSDGPIPIDDNLIAALSPRGSEPTSLHQFVRSLAPNGSVHLEQSRFVRSADDIQSLSKTIELSFYNGSIRYSGFRYPLFEIQGHISVDNQRITLQRMKGRNDSARIRCEGFVDCNNQRIRSMKLEFDSQNVPLEEELQAALPTGVQALWKHLRPSGVVDRVFVQLDRQAPDDPMQLAIRIQEDGKDDAVVGRSISLQPTALPYLLNNVACDVSYRPGYVQLDRFEASHDASHVSGEGGFQVSDKGTWNGTLTWLPTTRLNMDQSLLMSLPEYMRNPLMATEFRGPLAISGQTLVTSSSENSEPSVKAWDIQIEVEDGQLAGGTLASGIRGSLHILGENTDQGPTAKGYLTLDSLAVKGIPVTNLKGPIAITQSKLFAGRLASEVQVTPLAAQLVATRRRPEIMATSHDDFDASRSGVVQASGISAASSPSKPALEPASLFSTHSSSNDLPILDNSPQDIHANTLAGTLRLYGTHPLLEGQTELDIALIDADLGNFLADIGENHGQADGRLWLQCRLVGSFMHTNTLSGIGQAWLREASFYQMPVMTRLFRALSLKQPDDGAFERADVQFRVDGDRIPIDRISLDGDIIALRGNGWTNLRRELQLDLYAYVGNRSPLGTLFGPLVSQNDSATLLQLEVTGTTDRMDVRRAIPLIGSNWQQIFPERVSETSSEP